MLFGGKIKFRQLHRKQLQQISKKFFFLSQMCIHVDFAIYITPLTHKPMLADSDVCFTTRIYHNKYIMLCTLNQRYL